jgi:hypothetical protein
MKGKKLLRIVEETAALVRNVTTEGKLVFVWTESLNAGIV